MNIEWRCQFKLFYLFTVLSKLVFRFHCMICPRLCTKLKSCCEKSRKITGTLRGETGYRQLLKFARTTAYLLRTCQVSTPKKREKRGWRWHESNCLEDSKSYLRINLPKVKVSRKVCKSLASVLYFVVYKLFSCPSNIRLGLFWWKTDRKGSLLLKEIIYLRSLRPEVLLCYGKTTR